MKKAVFIDKDGTLITNVPYNVDTRRITFEPTAAKALAKLRSMGYLVIVVSNQSGVAKGLYSESDLIASFDYINSALRQQAAGIDAFYYCPHLLGGSIARYAVSCSCRKPKPGLVLRAADDFNVMLSESWMIGDILNDIEAGNRAGCRSVLIDNGSETEWDLTGQREPFARAETLHEAAELISQEHHKQRKFHGLSISR